MMNVEYSNAITEVLDILKHTKKDDVDKISPSFMQFLEENKSQTYIPKLDHSKRIIDMNLNEKTIGILCVINTQFWCDKEQRKEFTKSLIHNELKFKKAEI